MLSSSKQADVSLKAQKGNPAATRGNTKERGVKARNIELMHEEKAMQAALKAGDRAGAAAQQALEKQVDEVNKQSRITTTHAPHNTHAPRGQNHVDHNTQQNTIKL